MLTILLICYIVCSVLLILLILLNNGKGSELSILNYNNELLNSKDSNRMINRIIIIFAIMSIIINFLIVFVSKSYTDNNKEYIKLYNIKIK